ncbi:MAG: hypothetical protein RL297_15 [Pseudomonadota bacterium]
MSAIRPEDFMRFFENDNTCQSGSKPRPRLTQKRQLLGRGRAAEDGVAVGVAAKAQGDGLVELFKAQGAQFIRSCQ